MDVVQNENQKMRDLLKSSKLENVNAHLKVELISEADSLVLADYSLLDFYDLEEAVQKEAEEDLVDPNAGENLGLVELLTTPSNNDFLKEITEDWIPVLKEENGKQGFVDLAFNIETKEFDTISSLNNLLNLNPIRVRYCSYAGDVGFSQEYGNFYKNDPEYSIATIYNSFNLEEYIRGELKKGRDFFFSEREVRTNMEQDELER